MTPGTELTSSIPAPSRQPAAPEPELVRALSAAFSASVGGAIPAERLPADLRERLETRLAVLASALEPAGDSRIRLTLSTLADMQARTEEDPSRARVALARDVADLGGLPEWALIAAARAFRRGEIGDGKWRPTAGELRREAQRRFLPFAAERFEIERALKAPIEPERKPSAAERRAEVAAMVRAAAGVISPGPAPRPEGSVKPADAPAEPRGFETDAEVAARFRGVIGTPKMARYLAAMAREYERESNGTSP